MTEIYEEGDAPVGAFDTGPIKYDLDLEALYDLLKARNKKDREEWSGLVFLFNKIKRMIDRSCRGIPSDFIRLMLEKDKIDAIDFLILYLSGLIGCKESSVYLKDTVIFINVDSELLVENYFMEFIEQASEEVIRRLSDEISAVEQVEKRTKKEMLSMEIGTDLRIGCISAGA